MSSFIDPFGQGGVNSTPDLQAILQDMRTGGSFHQPVGGNP
jgi:hypothetical protein